MIRIRLPEKNDYYKLQKKYLEMIKKYVMFDERDIIPGSDKKPQGKSKQTAEKLRNSYPTLYKFLFAENSNTVKSDNLRRLLAGPDVLPDSFGGSGGIYETMISNFENIISLCPLPENEKVAINCCKEIFPYTNGFGKSVDDTYWLLRALNVRVCPYCNRIYTITLPSKEELANEKEFKTTRATLDHFYPKNKYPYLALSLFNLVPSCHICNNNKGAEDKKIIYPYDEAFEKNAVFRIIPDLKASREEESNPLNFLLGESIQFYIRFMGNGEVSLIHDLPLSERLVNIKDDSYRERIEKSVEIFRLEQQYEEHKEEVRDILRNRYYFNEQYIQNAVCPLLHQKMRNISIDQLKDIAMDMLFFTHLDQEEWGKRPLSKLTSDILDQIS